MPTAKKTASRPKRRIVSPAETRTQLRLTVDTAFVFPLTFEIADELERVGGEVLGGVNRSKAFRVMVAYFAFVHKLKNQSQTTLA